MQYVKLASERRQCAACLRKHTSTIQCGHGGTINLISPRNPTTSSRGYLDLLMEQDINSAMRKGFFQQVRILAHVGSDVNVRDEYGRTALMNCAMVDDRRWAVGLARTLLQHGAEPRSRDRKLGMTVLHYACVMSQPELVALLLKSAPDIDLAATDKRGNTPLHYVAATGNQLIVSAILDASSRYQYQLSLVDLPNHAGYTPLQLAFSNEQTACCDLLRSALVQHSTMTSSNSTTGNTAATSRRLSELNSGGDITAVDNPDGNTSHAGRETAAPTKATVATTTDPSPNDVITAVPSQFCSTSMTATSARQRRTESRQRTVADMVEDQLKPTVGCRPNLAVRASRQMMLTKGGRPSSAPSRTTKPGGLFPAEVIAARRLRTAAPDDPRNKPFGNIIATSAVEFFATSDGQERRLAENENASAVRPTSSSSLLQPRQMPLLTDQGDSWRYHVSRLYADYDYQFCSSYRPGARTPRLDRKMSGSTEVGNADDDVVYRLQATGDFGLRSLRNVPAGLRRTSTSARLAGSASTQDLAANGHRKSTHQMLTSSGSSSSSLMTMTSVVTGANTSQRGKKYLTLGIDGVHHADGSTSGLSTSVRPKSGRSNNEATAVAVVAAVQKKGRRHPEISDNGLAKSSTECGGRMRASHLPIETSS